MPIYLPDGGVHLNWKAIGEFTDLREVLEAIPPQEIIKRLGVPLVLETVGVAGILAAVGQSRRFDAKGAKAFNRSDGVRCDWKMIGEFTDLVEVVDAMPPEDVIEWLGVPFVLRSVGVSGILASVGAPGGFDAKEIEALCIGLMAHITPERIREMI